MSIHFDHAGVEVGAPAHLRGVAADAADRDDIDEADEHCPQAPEGHDAARPRHEVLEGVVAVGQPLVAVCLSTKVPLLVQSLMSLNR